jgi:hypothetical protein
MAQSPAPTPASDTPNMVLRTVYLPVAMDEDLKNAALLIGRSKNDLIRELVAAGLAEGTAAARALAESRSRTIAPVAVKAPARRADTGTAPAADPEAIAKVTKTGKGLTSAQERARAIAAAAKVLGLRKEYAPDADGGEAAQALAIRWLISAARHKPVAAVGKKAAAAMADERRTRQRRKAMLRAGKKGTRSSKGLDA